MGQMGPWTVQVTPLVAAEAEGVAGGVGMDPEPVAVGADEVVLHGRREGQDPALFGVDVVDFDAEMELLAVFAVRPLQAR